MSLDRYAHKRTFTRTPEPAPKLTVARQGPLLFVVQKHAASRLHYDFRLELDGVLRSWAVPKGPSLDPKEKRMAVEVEDHPFDYASFEGVIPAKQYGAGSVIVWDCGVYSPDEGQRFSFDDRSEAEERIRRELAQGKLSFLLCGTKLKGSFALVKTSAEKQWLLIKHKDRFVGHGSDALAAGESVLSGCKVDQVAALPEQPPADAALLVPSGPNEAMPRKLSPMLAELGTDIRSDPAWRYEPKLDGYRIIAFVRDGEVRLVSRGGLNMTAAFPEITSALAQHPASMILDGEVVALSADGRPSFNALQQRAQLKTAKEIEAAQRATPVAMVCFDLLHFAGCNLRDSVYSQRRRYLTQCLLPSEHVQLIHSTEEAETLYAAALANGFEGIVAKCSDGTYKPGRRASVWVKLKAKNSAEFVVGGYTKGKGSRASIGALLLGYWKGKELHYVGHVGSGLSENIIDDLRVRFSELPVKRSPFIDKPSLHRPTTWLVPQLVVEVSFEDRTPDGLLRAPVFVRLRDDLAARSVRRAPEKRGKQSTPVASPADEVEAVLEQLQGSAAQLELSVAGARIKLTSLDRVYWPADPRAGYPAITKRDHIRYLARVSPFMLPHLVNRPLTMIRMPAGIHGERFFQKHWEQSLPNYVETVTVFSEHKDEQHDYLLGNNLPTLLWLGQNGTLEFHVWHSRAELGADAAVRSTDYASSRTALEASVLNYPDYLVFDIDPYIYSGKEAKGAEPELNKKGFTVGRKVAFWIHALLNEMSLQAIVKTSGKTGLHVFVPIERSVTFDEARQICEMVGRHVMKAHPKEVTMEWAVVKRAGKIFIDHNMNVRGKTLNVAYSPRGVPGAPISMPLTWEELEAAEPMDFTMANALSRLEKGGDRWHDALSAKQNLRKVFGSVG